MEKTTGKLAPPKTQKCVEIVQRDPKIRKNEQVYSVLFFQPRIEKQPECTGEL
jgi:hypothetical protein